MTIATMRELEAEIDKHVLEALSGWPCDVSTRQLQSVCLDDYPTKGQVDLSYVGDDSWGDFGVNILISNGKVVNAYGGD